MMNLNWGRGCPAAMLLVTGLLNGTVIGLFAQAPETQTLAVPVEETDSAPDTAVQQSVVRIFSTIRYPQLYKPWNKTGANESTGTGFFITGPNGRRLVLTNNHVVRWASQIYVQGYSSGERHRAKVVAAAPDMDLALLELTKPGVLEDRGPLRFIEGLPDSGDSVSVYGYPTGGNELSVTRGIISRLEVAGYDEGTVGLRLQVDAAINPGNSGGPALVDDRVVGVAFQTNSSAENIGYLIPASEVQRFLDDIADGEYDRKPRVIISFQTLENPAARSFLKLTPQQTGVLISEPELGHVGLPLATQIQPYDVLTHIGPHQLDNQGDVDIATGLRGHYSYYVEALTAEDGTVPLTVIRDGQSIELREPTYRNTPRLMSFIGNGYPRYYIFGPMVFTAATRDFYSYVPENYVPYLGMYRSPLVTRLLDSQAFLGEELVCVASPFFPHPMVRDYDNPQFNVIKTINDTPIKNLEHLVQVLNESEEQFFKFVYQEEGSEDMIFDRVDMKESTEGILNDNGIRYQYSSDLREIAEVYED